VSDTFNHPLRKGAVLRLDCEEPGVSKIAFIESRLLDIDDQEYQYILVDYSNTYSWQYHEDDVEYLFVDTGKTSTDTKIYKAMQPELHDELTAEYGDLGEFPHGTPEGVGR